MIKVIKRNGNIVNFQPMKILKAIKSAMKDTPKGFDTFICSNVVMKVQERINSLNKNEISVNEIQDIVEEELMKTERIDVAKKYILYRKSRDEVRNFKQNFNLLDDEFISQYKHEDNPIKTQVGNFVYSRTYSRWLPEEKRREFWWETVRRSIEYNTSLAPTPKEEAQELFDNVFHLRQFPSGRTLWVGGTEVALEYSMSNFNCSGIVIQNFEAFKDMFYLLMLGSGVGFRILKSDVAKLPKIRNNYNLIHEEYSYDKDKLDNSSITFISNETVKIKIGDSKEGWSQAIDFYFKILYSHEFKNIKTIILNYNYVRPKGAKLKKFGGTASGHESLKNMFMKIDKVIKNASSEERFNLRPIHCLDIANIISENVVSGGVRRSSGIGLIDFDDEECIKAKSQLYKQINGKWEIDRNIAHRQMSNNSIFYDAKPSREQLHWNFEQIRFSGEPAFINHEAMKKRKQDTETVNPCITGDTLIAVADGRNAISIKQLAEEGKDIPVYCKDNNGKLKIRMMRNPRITGYDKDIYAVELNDGSVIKCTNNHKFIMKDGSIKEVKDLQENDSLMITSKVEFNNNTETKYLCINDNSNSIPEHRFIYEELNKTKLTSHYCIHHIDKNGLNNDINNLQKVTWNEHNLIHEKSIGENNGKYIKISNEKLFNEMIKLAKEKGKLITRNDWQNLAKEKGYPQSFSSFRGNLQNYIENANIEAGYIEKPLKNSKIKAEYNKYLNLLKTSDLELSFNDGIYITKKCEYCGKEFKLKYSERERSYCSIQCVGKVTTKKSREVFRKIVDERRETKINILIENFSKFVCENKKIPTFDEFTIIMKENDINDFRTIGMISYQNFLDKIKNNFNVEISTKLMRYNKNNYISKKAEELIDNGMEYNHKVVSVTYIGKDTVYNGTVDDYHNYGIMINEGMTKYKNKQYKIIYTVNCGEVLLLNKQQCNLVTINVFAFVKEDGTLDYEKLYRAQYLSARMALRMTCVELELPEWSVNQKKDRLTGCSMTGWQDMVNAVKMSKTEEIRLLKALREIAHNASYEYSKQLGIEQSALITTVKPEGSISQIPTVSSGVHYSHSPYFIRRVRISSNDPLCKVCEELEYPVYPEVGQDPETCVTKYVEFPVKAPEGKTKYDVSAIEQLENYKMFMENYVDHNCSITISVREHEWAEVEEWVWNNWDTIVGVSFISLDDNFYKAMPYEAITKEEYEKRLNSMKPFVSSIISKYEIDETELDLGNESCSNGICPVR